MKRLLFLLILVGILSINPVKNIEVLAINASYIATGTALKTIFVNQDPYPANPSEYVDLLFKIENWGTKKAENVVFELLPEYPFSLDTGVSATKELGTVESLATGEKAYFVKYKVRVDEDAIDGENEIGWKYTYGTGLTYSVSTGTVDVTIEDSQTDFDVVVQDSTATSTTLAIANIGANTAYSVIVRIPDQENFRVTGTSANVMGNLDAGDYTLVNFQISSTGNFTGTQMFIRNTTESAIRNITSPASGRRNLIVEVSYTDELGIRRTIQKEVRLNAVGTTGYESMQSMHEGQSQNISSGLMYIGVGIVGVIVIVVFFKFRKRKER